MSGLLGRRHPHAPSVLDHSEHVNRFSSFEGSLREARELAQKVTPERDYAYLLERAPTLDFTGVERGDGSAGKVKRVPVDIHHDLDGVAVNVFLPFDDAARKVHAGHGRVSDHGRNGGDDHARRDHRLVSLDHHDDISFKRRGRLGDAIAGALMGGRRHNDWRAESFGDAADLFIAGRDVNRVEESAHRGPAEDVLDHRSPQNPGKRLARKPGRPHPRWNNSDDPHYGSPKSRCPRTARRNSETERGDDVRSEHDESVMQILQYKSEDEPDGEVIPANQSMQVAPAVSVIPGRDAHGAPQRPAGGVFNAPDARDIDHSSRYPRQRARRVVQWFE